MKARQFHLILVQAIYFLLLFSDSVYLCRLQHTKCRHNLTDLLYVTQSEKKWIVIIIKGNCPSKISLCKKKASCCCTDDVQCRVEFHSIFLVEKKKEISILKCKHWYGKKEISWNKAISKVGGENNQNYKQDRLIWQCI